MSYQQFTNPSGGYQVAKQNGGYSNSSAPYNLIIPNPKRSIVIPSYKKEGEFTEKNVYEGVGNFHVNHFIGYFTTTKNLYIPSSKDILIFNREFFNNFGFIFSVKNVSDASLSKHTYKNKKTVCFKLGGNINKLVNYSEYFNIPYFNIDKLGGIFHEDWVSFEMADNQLSFYGSTLKRKWVEKLELKLFSQVAELTKAVGLIDDNYSSVSKFITNFIEVNQHHFLAGRRSWRVGYDEDLNHLYVETLAFERSSLCEYSMLEKTGKLRETILDLWINLILNYVGVHKFMLYPIFYIPKDFNLISRYDYEFRGNVLYKVAEDKSSANILNTPWVKEAMTRHPGLLKDL